MLALIRKLFRVGYDSRKAAEYWSKWQQAVDGERPRYIDWGDHPAVLARMYEEHFNSRQVTLVHYLRNDFPQFQQSSALSLCCGDGAFENLLVEQGVFGSIKGLDIAEARVHSARDKYCVDGKALVFEVADVNEGKFGHQQYDVVIAKASLHHIERLETVFAGICSALKPEGRLLTIDFFGPTRFQWSDAQLVLANQALVELPEALRTRLDGTIKSLVTRPTVEEMIEADPSEAVRSSDLYGLLRRYFTIEREFDIGGTLLSLVLTTDILHNFDSESPEHIAYIDKLYDYERKHIRSGALTSDFKFIIACKR